MCVAPLSLPGMQLHQVYIRTRVRVDVENFDQDATRRKILLLYIYFHANDYYYSHLHN